jgi:hypothetical protein
MPKPLIDYVITEHAAFEIGRRGLTEELVRRVLAAPEQRYEAQPGREVFQIRTSMGDPPKKTYVVRVFVDVDRHPSEVVTAYRTSRIAKYWRQT